MKQSNAEFKVGLKKRPYAFALDLIHFLDKLPSDMVSKRLGDQLLRSGTSVLANFVEGQAAGSKREFTNFLVVSLRSANESKVWLALLRDSKRSDAGICNILLKELDEISKILASSVMTLKGKRE
ncbi:MAG: four helix bundle protein [Sedimentisphaerales bacterium]|nr:four helix bundle protein [Sedimentisphaerales bacterium]